MNQAIDGTIRPSKAARFSRVYTSDSLVVSDDWELVPFLFCTELREEVAPAVPQATLEWELGRFTEYYGADQLQLTRRPQDFLRKYVKIEIVTRPGDEKTETEIGEAEGPFNPMADGESVIEYTWFGIIEAEQLRLDATNATNAGGVQQITAYGLIRELERVIVDKTIMLNYDGDGVIEIDRGLTFNDNETSALQQFGNRSQNVIETDGGTTWVFHHRQWDGSPETKPRDWDAYTALDYLITNFAPKKNSVQTDPICEWKIAEPVANITEAVDTLGWYDIKIPTDRRSLKDIIDDLIDRRRFAGWYVYGDDDGEEFVARIKVFSFSDRTIRMPGGRGSVTENSDQTQVRVLGKHDVSRFEIINNGTTEIDEILVEGEKITTTMSAWVSVLDEEFNETHRGLLERDWLFDDRIEYTKGASETEGYDDLDEEEQIELNATFRSRDKYRNVFSRFTMTGRTNNSGNPFHKNRPEDMSPYMFDANVINELQIGNISTTVKSLYETEPTNLWTHGLRVLPYLPQKDNGADATPEEYVAPFVIANLEGRGGVWNTDDKRWQHGEQLNADQERTFSVSMEPLPDAFGVRVSVGLAGAQQLIAKDSWTEEAGILPESLDPLEDENNAIHYTDLVFTFAFNWHARVFAYRNLRALSVDTANRKKYIYAPDARFDWRMPYTIEGINDDGSLEYSMHAWIIRDDRERLQAIARAAAEWYRVPRQALALSYGQLTTRIRPTINGVVNLEPVKLGTLITTVSAQVSKAGINSPVTAITFDLIGQNTTITTTYFEGDFV